MNYNAQKKAIDNRANQLNPNNPAYQKSRMGNQNKNKHNNHQSNNKPKNNNGQTSSCEICGVRGMLPAIRGRW